MTTESTATEIEGYDATAVSHMDSIVTFQRQNGAVLIFSNYGTPVQYASTTNNRTYPDNVTKGPWGNYGEGSYPTSLAPIQRYVGFLIHRYNLGGAWQQANPLLGKGIYAWEPWNEPSYNADGTSAGNLTLSAPEPRCQSTGGLTVEHW